ncbi:MAG: LptA/OstA family protein [Mesorhizobium sp.]|nr:LptA/OstA family protein [Mesorhizobium sp.]MCO5160759.1 LptA/OstA family protein [Mesorhizobium sp.]
MRLIRISVGLCASLALAASAAVAQERSSSFTGLQLQGDKPIQIESDKLEVRDGESMAIFTGNVSVVQGDTLLKSGKMTVHYKKKEGADAAAATMPGGGNIERMEVDGKVYVKSKTQVATGDRGTFDMATEIMTLTGEEVVLTEGPNVIVGCKLTVEMKTGAAKLDGCGSGSGRVKMLLTPQKQGQ